MAPKSCLAKRWQLKDPDSRRDEMAEREEALLQEYFPNAGALQELLEALQERGLTPAEARERARFMWEVNPADLRAAYKEYGDIGGNVGSNGMVVRTPFAGLPPKFWSTMQAAKDHNPDASTIRSSGRPSRTSKILPRDEMAEREEAPLQECFPNAEALQELLEALQECGLTPAEARQRAWFMWEVNPADLRAAYKEYGDIGGNVGSNGMVVRTPFAGLPPKFWSTMQAAKDHNLQAWAAIGGKILDQNQELREAFDLDPQDAIHKMFSLLDKDKSGEISFQNLRSMVEELGQKMSEDEIYDIIDEADTDTNGFVNKDEFMHIMWFRKD